jgi:hypothetical protein
VGVAEYARLSTGAHITRGSSANGALPITGTRITLEKNANSALPIHAGERSENKQRRMPYVHKRVPACVEMAF